MKLAWLALGSAMALHAVEPVALMPRARDYTHMHWAEGFPESVRGASWRRVVQTGYYAMALDTDTMRVPHLGPVAQAMSYADAARSTNDVWNTLPAADLRLRLTVDGKTYRCTKGGRWTRLTGPRLIESGRFMQRADVTDLLFTSDDGMVLNAETRFETAAWPDRLALVLAAKPGQLPIPAGDDCFGFVGGGFGLNGKNHFAVPHSEDLEPERFTLEMQVFVPADHQVSEKFPPWLVCKNAHELAPGHYGIILIGGKAQARMNIGGGHENAFSVQAREPLRIEAWNHLAISYDGDALRLWQNGALAAEQKIGRQRIAGRGGLAIGRRQDNHGDGYHFRGVVDEIELHHRALTAKEMTNPAIKPAREWHFRENGVSSMTRPKGTWQQAELGIHLENERGELHQQSKFVEVQDWREIGIAFDPVMMKADEPASSIRVSAEKCPVSFDALRGWHRVSLNEVEPVVPDGAPDRRNDAIERVQLILENTDEQERTARLLFEQTKFRAGMGAPITGISAMLRDPNGTPTGIPVQISKNWHHGMEGGVHSGLWFHGFTQVHLPAKAQVTLEFTLCHGHWGGVAAASHAQLCLIGWGSNQLWDQSALGAWGESICYEPDQAQAACLITDVRPLMVRSMHNGGQWQWTNNVGGGDCFRLFDASGGRVQHSRMRTAYHKQGPCLTEVTYAGRIGTGIEHQFTTSLARTDDLIRGTYRLRLDVHAATDFSRFVLFQIGADTYSYTGERKMALGNETGLTKEWLTQWGGDINRTEPMKTGGQVPWISLHEARPHTQRGGSGAWANRGLVIREWKARFGGQEAAPWIVERGVRARGSDSSTLDIVPPPGIRRLLPGDFIEATIEHLILPMSAEDYYGPNEALRSALKAGADTWRMVHREAAGNDRHIEMKAGKLLRTHPAITIETAHNTAEFALTGGLGWTPITVIGLTSPDAGILRIDGKVLDQSLHGSDFWQTDFDPASETWSLTYNVPAKAGQTLHISFK